MPSGTDAARYEIRVAGVLDSRWTAWFDGFEISSQGEDTLMCGLLPDQPALHGLLTKVRDLGLSLISVRRLDTSQVADQLTGLTATAEEVIAARPELVWDLVADVTRVGGWSPECIRTAWLDQPGRPRPGARFTGRNRFPNGFEYEVTCQVTEADRPSAFAWVVLDDLDDPARPSSSWQYRIDPLPGGRSQVRQRFTHGPGTSFLREAAAEAPDRATELIAARLDWLTASMRTTLQAIKITAESAPTS